ncbi:hypothetical protein CYMTET_14670 [Cymbomonas tetramitiformis]|uniref:Uncharacterized protein n=1 Tax=Cymbomonas tetramitiformis TaxID=36881 RepID=A0AAE0GFW4_9CHLO|nr:hypothetical protein CYMTET_14670 [Cymbomonas tetramitiformis]
MTSTQILSEDEELIALLSFNEDSLQKVDSLKRVQLVSLCHSLAKALTHLRCSQQTLPRFEVPDSPAILSIVVPEGTAVGGAVSDRLITSDVCFSEMGVGDELAVLTIRSVSSQITTTRPATGPSGLRRLTQRAPTVRVERHFFYHSVDSRSSMVDSERDIHAVYESSESEDESEFPPGYCDDSDDLCEETGGQLASPTFSASQLVQQPTLDTGFHEGSYGGVFEAFLEAEFSPQQNISTGSASVFVESAEPVDDDSDFSQEHEHSEFSGCASDVGHGDHRYDCESGGAGYDSDGGYSPGYS